MEKNAEFYLVKSRMRLIISQPFFGGLALRLILREARPGELPLPTIATDGRHLIYTPEFIMDLVNGGKQDELLGIMCHEIMHCVMQHPTRLLKYPNDMRRLIATDIAINPIIRDAGFKLPKDALYPAKFGFPEGLTAEEYWKMLTGKMEEATGRARPGEQGQGGCQAGGCAGVQNLPGESGEGEQGGDGEGKGKHASAAEIAAAESEWSIAVSQAVQVARAAGKMPAGLERLIDEIRKPRVPWQDVLRRFINQRSTDDYRMFPPNRRFVWQNIYLPSLRSDAVGEIVVVYDMSGSIGKDELNAFFGETFGICEDMRPRKLHLISFDTMVHTHQEFTPEDYPLEAKAVNVKGGGGTLFRPVFNYIEEKDIKPVCMLFLTDMCPGDPWPEQPDYPVLWVATTDIEGPWGETVKIDVRD